MIIESDLQVLTVWNWCRKAYEDNGVKIRFPKDTDPKKTYQWRYISKLHERFVEWQFDEETSKEFISIVIYRAKQRNLLSKGLAAFHQSNMLDICYDILTKKLAVKNREHELLTSMKKWFDMQVGQSDVENALLNKSGGRNSLSTICMWYQANKVNELFLSLSKSCNKAVFKLQSSNIDSAMLPSIEDLFLTREKFLADSENVDFTSKLFKGDWRKPCLSKS